MKKKLVVSFSGGRTSAYMLWYIFNEWDQRHEYEILVVFANTGKEVEGTLFFVDECSNEWGIPITWVEGYPRNKGKGWSVEHKIVTYETASRNGEPFEAMIKKLGIPNTQTPFCSPQLKREAIKDFLKSIGWDDYYIAIGIRYDESEDRMDKNWLANKIIYPFIFSKQVIKRNVNEWWLKQSFNLDIHPDDGNCDNCWKKDMPRLVRNMIRKPESFNWWNEMIEKYGLHNPRDYNIDKPFSFYRGQVYVSDIQEMAKMSQAELKQISMFDEVSGCNESCEVW